MTGTTGQAPAGSVMCASSPGPERHHRSATAALRLSARPAIGILTRRSHAAS